MGICIIIILFSFNDGVGVEYGLEVNTNDILRVIYDSENRKL